MQYSFDAMQFKCNWFNLSTKLNDVLSETIQQYSTFFQNLATLLTALNKHGPVIRYCLWNSGAVFYNNHHWGERGQDTGRQHWDHVAASSE